MNLPLPMLNSPRIFQSVLPSRIFSDVTFATAELFWIFPSSVPCISRCDWEHILPEALWQWKDYFESSTNGITLYMPQIGIGLSFAWNFWLLWSLWPVICCAMSCILNWLIVPQNHCLSLICCIGFFILFLWIDKIVLNSLTSLKLDLNHKFEI